MPCALGGLSLNHCTTRQVPIPVVSILSTELSAWSLMRATTKEKMPSWMRTFWHTFVKSASDTSTVLAPHTQIREAPGTTSRMKHPEPYTSSSATPSVTLHLSEPWVLICTFWRTDAATTSRCWKDSRRFSYFQGLARHSVSGTHWDVSESYSQP